MRKRDVEVVEFKCDSKNEAGWSVIPMNWNTMLECKCDAESEAQSTDARLIIEIRDAGIDEN